MCTPLRANSLSFPSAFSTCYNDRSLGFSVLSLYGSCESYSKEITNVMQCQATSFNWNLLNRKPDWVEAAFDRQIHPFVIVGQQHNTWLWIRPLCLSSYHNAFVLSIDGDTRRPDLSPYKVELPPPWLLGHHYLIGKMAKMSSRHVYKLSNSTVYF